MVEKRKSGISAALGGVKGVTLGCALALLLNAVAGAASLVSQYSSRVWQMDQGLPQAFVQAIVQTRDGYLWVGTQNGVARFDGLHFTVFNLANVPEMVNANIVALHEARDGSLWIGTGSGGVLHLINGRFVHYGASDGLAHDASLGTICESSDGAVWFATLKGLSRFEDGKFTTFGLTNGLSSDIVRDMCEDLQGNLWLATSAGVDCWNHGAVLRHYTTEDGLKSMETRAICCDREGTIWVGAGDGLSRLQNGKITTFGKSQGYNMITRLYADRHGGLWVGSFGGLSRFVDGKLVPQFYNDGLPFDLVRAVLEDRDENIWVGSRDGLIQLTTRRFAAYTQQQGLANNNVISVLEDSSGAMWIGTWGGGLNLLRDEDITVYTNRAPTPRLTTALHEDRAGQIWAGEDFSGGLYCLNENGCRRFSTRQGLPDAAVRSIYQDRQTNLWVGTARGLYRKEGPKFVPFGPEHGMGTAIVRAFCEDRAGNLWIGTEEGLWQLRDCVPAKFTGTNGLPHAAVIALLEDHEGVIWIGTAGGGLNRLKNGNVSAIMSGQGLLSDTICEILEDQRGCLWLSSPRGVSRINIEDYERVIRGKARSVNSVAYGKADGMSTELCNGVAKPGAWKSRDGRLWFATTKGLCVIDPNTRIEGNHSPPPVVIERVIADKQPFPASETQALPETVRIPPGRGDFEFHYTALSFRLPERNRFKYKLQGVDTDWVDAGPRRIAYYNHIHPGRYRFQVVAGDKDSVWNLAGASVNVVFLPQFWQTGWFKVAVAGGVGVLFFGLHRLRLARLREVEHLRLRIAADLHDEVGSNLGTISLLSRKVQKDGAVRGAEKEDLAAISRISTQTSNSIREIVWFINPECDTMQDLVSRMKEVASSDIKCQFRTAGVDLSRHLPPQFRQNFFLLFKEALANANRHSRASQIDIALAQKDHSWLLSVRDNGIGFDSASSSGGNGLKNMRFRAARLRGTLEITSRPGNGTNVIFSTKIP